MMCRYHHHRPLPPQSHFSVYLCLPNEDLAEIKRKYKVLGPPPVTSPDYFENLGFVNGSETLMYVSHKKAKFPGKSLYALARSWFKEGVTKENKCVSKDMHKMKCHRTDDVELKGYLKEFLEEAQAVKILVGMSGRNRKTVKKKVLSTSIPCSKKRKYAPKTRSLNDILMAMDHPSVA